MHNKCVWTLDPIARGNAIEQALADSEYSMANGWGHLGALDDGFFPLVDFCNGTEVVSLKTVDRGPNSYWGDLYAHVNDLANTTITEGGVVQQKVLDLRVPPGKLSSVQALADYARSKGLRVIVSEYK